MNPYEFDIDRMEREMEMERKLALAQMEAEIAMLDERSDVPTETTVRMLAYHAPQITPEAMEAYCSTLERAEHQKGRNGHWRERNAPFYMGVPKRARNKRR